MRFIFSFILLLLSNHCYAKNVATIIPTFPIEAWHQEKNCPKASNLDALVKETLLNMPRVVGVSIAISHPNCGFFNAVYGLANIDQQIPMNENTKLPIASNTKPVLLALTLMLMEKYPHAFPDGIDTRLTDIRDFSNNPIFTADGQVLMPNGRRINLTKPDFFKIRTGQAYDCHKDTVYQCPNLADINLHQLLLESSGLADYIRETDLSHDNSTEMLKFVFAKLFSSQADPGSQEVKTDLQALKWFGLVKKNNPEPLIPTQSHNTDASLLAIILERVSEKSLNDLMIEHILIPLGLPEDAMQFVTKSSNLDFNISRQYALLNTDEEIEKAIREQTLFPMLNETTARLLLPTVLATIGRNLYPIGDGLYAIDALDLHGQGLFGFPGPAGIIAQPKAYIQFYSALASGKLLNSASQQLFEESFLPQTNNDTAINLAKGYASNNKTQWLSSPKLPTFLSHGGFVPGGESWVIYNYETGLSVMIASNTSGSWRDTLPLLFVTPTDYFDKNAIQALALKYIDLFNIF